MDSIKERIRRQMVRGYLEMPGLALSLEEARHFWLVDREVARSLLSELVERGFLSLTRSGRFARPQRSERKVL